LNALMKAVIGAVEGQVISCVPILSASIMLRSSPSWLEWKRTTSIFPSEFFSTTSLKYWSDWNWADLSFSPMPALMVNCAPKAAEAKSATRSMATQPVLIFICFSPFMFSKCILLQKQYP